MSIQLSYRLCKNPQGSPEWLQDRVGILTGSSLLKYLGLSKYSNKSPETYARQCMGLEKEEFSQLAKSRMALGTKGEPLLRDWYSKEFGVQVCELGLGISTKDPRFGSSLDGLIITDDNGDGNKSNNNSKKRAVEFKVTHQIYPSLFDPKEFPRKLDDIQNCHINPDHYVQMLMAIFVYDLESIDYVVGAYINNKVYVETVYPNPELWDEIYAKACTWYDTYITPLKN